MRDSLKWNSSWPIRLRQNTSNILVCNVTKHALLHSHFSRILLEHLVLEPPVDQYFSEKEKKSYCNLEISFKRCCVSTATLSVPFFDLVKINFGVNILKIMDIVFIIVSVNWSSSLNFWTKGLRECPLLFRDTPGLARAESSCSGTSLRLELFSLMNCQEETRKSKKTQDFLKTISRKQNKTWTK